MEDSDGLQILLKTMADNTQSIDNKMGVHLQQYNQDKIEAALVEGKRQEQMATLNKTMEGINISLDATKTIENRVQDLETSMDTMKAADARVMTARDKIKLYITVGILGAVGAGVMFVIKAGLASIVGQ